MSGREDENDVFLIRSVNRGLFTEPLQVYHVGLSRDRQSLQESDKVKKHQFQE